MGKVSKGIKCNVQSCKRVAIRSLSLEKVKSAGLEVETTRRAYLCKDHYKEYKKSTKNGRTLDRWRYQPI